MLERRDGLEFVTEARVWQRHDDNAEGDDIYFLAHPCNLSSHFESTIYTVLGVVNPAKFSSASSFFPGSSPSLLVFFFQWPHLASFLF